jgi:hypothetical protein
MLSGIGRAPIALALLLVLPFAPALSPAAAGGTHDGASEPQPTLIVTPEPGSCNSRFVARAEHFPPGASVSLIIRLVQAIPDNLPTLSGTVAPDGTFTIEIPPFAIACLPGQPQGPERRYEVIARLDFQAGSAGTVLASATFTVTSPSSPPPGLPNTGGGGQARIPPSLWLLAIGWLLVALAPGGASSPDARSHDPPHRRRYRGSGPAPPGDGAANHLVRVSAWISV